MNTKRENRRPKRHHGQSRRKMVRLLGKLTDLQPDEHRFTLHLDDGMTVPCVLVDADWGMLERQGGRRSIVEGMAVWKVKVPLLRVEYDRVASGDREQPLWSRLPTMPLHTSDLPPEALTPRPWGTAAIMGKWPGDESDEEITRLLEEIS